MMKRLLRMIINSFILDYDFDGDINKLLVAIQKGEAITYNEMPFPIKNAYTQGKQIVLPLWHKNIVVDLNNIHPKDTPQKITMNIRR